MFSIFSHIAVGCPILIAEQFISERLQHVSLGLDLPGCYVFWPNTTSPLSRKNAGIYGNITNTGIQKLILLIYSKLSLNECNQAICIACYCFPKKLWKYLQVVWHVSALLSFRKCQQTRGTAFVKQAKHGETSWALEQVDYSWIQMIWNGSQVLLQMTSRWAPLHSSTRLRHEHAWTVHPGREIA